MPPSPEHGTAERPWKLSRTPRARRTHAEPRSDRRLSGPHHHGRL